MATSIPSKKVIDAFFALYRKSPHLLTSVQQQAETLSLAGLFKARLFEHQEFLPQVISELPLTSEEYFQLWNRYHDHEAIAKAFIQSSLPVPQELILAATTQLGGVGAKLLVGTRTHGPLLTSTHLRAALDSGLGKNELINDLLKTPNLPSQLVTELISSNPESLLLFVTTQQELIPTLEQISSALTYFKNKFTARMATKKYRKGIEALIERHLLSDEQIADLVNQHTFSAYLKPTLDLGRVGFKQLIATTLEQPAPSQAHTAAYVVSNHHLPDHLLLEFFLQTKHETVKKILWNRIATMPITKSLLNNTNLRFIELSEPSLSVKVKIGKWIQAELDKGLL